jgi:hypothetical protein
MVNKRKIVGPVKESTLVFPESIMNHFTFLSFLFEEEKEDFNL